MFTTLYFLFNFAFSNPGQPGPSTAKLTGGAADSKKQDALADYYLRVLLLEMI
jgi:hypothetical protein